ncbi:MscS Mechanosensitive ion channel [Rippkaea orientalis PCC 8801]|uniref:MscS Mechanosensitive ion channel n=1 Tax=Rippkaea orientalis (strain PCC 8801 / RF-1) TaxID=41431 RepID=B7JXR9_RIPO1|nr:mechanosensitive ion channel family protein [Rippkaea orientalis]ACK64826.1 MscS Mechanosensitive ion channel [Rippkaea orientalis PCC 8801]
MKQKLQKFLALLLTTITLMGILGAFSHNLIAQDSASATKFPVIFDGNTLFYVQRPSGSLAPEERAELIRERLEKIVKNRDVEINDQDFDLDNKGDVVIILFKNKTLATVTTEDAKLADVSTEILAEQYLQKIQEAIQRYHLERQPFYWILGIVLTVVTTILLIVTLKIFDKIFPYIYTLLNDWRDHIIPSIRIQNLELLSSENLTKICEGFVRLVRIILTLLILYLFIPLVLSFFPQTRRIGHLLFDYLMTAINLVGNSLVSYLPNIFIIGVIIYLTYYTLRLLKFIFTEIENENLNFPGFYPEWAQPTYRLLNWIIIALAAVFTFPYLPGFNSPAFRGVSAFLALLFTLGSTGVVSNTVSGFVLIYTRAFQVGDIVKIADATGKILEKTLLVTRIQTVKNVVITIPNSVVISSNVVNYSALSRDTHSPLIIHTTITLGYDIPWRTVHETLIKAAKATPHILSEPSPFVWQTSLNDFHISYEINGYTFESSKMMETYSDLHQNIQDKCNEAGIEILSPQYSALRDGNHNTIPENYLPEDYVSPGFKIEPVTNLLNLNKANRKH